MATTQHTSPITLTVTEPAAVEVRKFMAEENVSPATRAGLECRPEGGQRPHTVKDDPQPQPPVAFGFSKVNPDSWKLLL